MRVLISKLIRISKQRVDFEKKRHKTLVTLDIQHQIEEVNWTVNENWEKRMAEEENKRVQTKGGNQVGGDLEKDANSSEPSKAYEAKRRRVTEILHTAAVNVAALAAVGGGPIPKSQPNEQMISASSHIWPRTHGDGCESEEKGIFTAAYN
ncbi:hypothetical protein Acr_23g0006370 [Actinidia rufa]|uniref:Transcription initiation factor TFIID component TAF4 C-terminal domain-containing protein n=1 Tax=Actinidia rufa TaxID=165716 RepID=A0A7J0GN93_9ERIC|nr:hypothetical protein Acr_23g0006370 [Actinidia rufa]